MVAFASRYYIWGVHKDLWNRIFIRQTGWKFESEDGEPRVCQANESHGQTATTHEIYNKGDPHPRLETSQDLKHALVEFSEFPAIFSIASSNSSFQGSLAHTGPDRQRSSLDRYQESSEPRVTWSLSFRLSLISPNNSLQFGGW